MPGQPCLTQPRNNFFLTFGIHEEACEDCSCEVEEIISKSMPRPRTYSEILFLSEKIGMSKDKFSRQLRWLMKVGALDVWQAQELVGEDGKVLRLGRPVVFYTIKKK